MRTEGGESGCSQVSVRKRISNDLSEIKSCIRMGLSRSPITVDADLTLRQEILKKAEEVV